MTRVFVIILNPGAMELEVFVLITQDSIYEEGFGGTLPKVGTNDQIRSKTSATRCTAAATNVDDLSDDGGIDEIAHNPEKYSPPHGEGPLRKVLQKSAPIEFMEDSLAARNAQAMHNINNAANEGNSRARWRSHC